jgi:hypothetical protein
MATTKAKTTKAEADEAAPEVKITGSPSGLAAGDDDHSGWEHDWRNPDAKFDRSDHCPNAELRRLAPR